MWRDLETEAIKIGLSLPYFWSLDVKQFQKYIKVWNETEVMKTKQQDLLNHMLAQYIGLAINDPKKFPRQPYTYQEKERELEPMQVDEMEKQARLNTIKMGGVIK